MSVFVALLRAVNVGGTGKLPMAELRALCEGLGFTDVSTYIQSGNIVFRTKLQKAKAADALEGALRKQLGESAWVCLRTVPELSRLVAEIPFPEVLPNQLLVLFLKKPPKAAELKQIVAPGKEQICGAKCEVIVHYPDGMGRSKLKLPQAAEGTGRNLNTVNKLLNMGRKLEE